MKKIVIIGSSGAGKSFLSKRLSSKLNIPVIHLDNIWWNNDKTHITREEFDYKLQEILSKDEWIIDGDYSRTYEMRFNACDTIIFLNYSLELCLESAKSRIGTERGDLPWVEDEFDPEFEKWIKEWHQNRIPIIQGLIEKYSSSKKIYVFTSREETDNWFQAL